MGSLYVQYLLQNKSMVIVPNLLRYNVSAIGIIVVVYVLLLPLIASTIMALPESFRILSAFLIAAPLAFAMGMPFPLGLASLQKSNPQYIPWAWGINGCASVIGAVLGTCLVVSIGFRLLMFAACALYFLAITTFFIGFRDGGKSKFLS